MVKLAKIISKTKNRKYILIKIIYEVPEGYLQELIYFYDFFPLQLIYKNLNDLDSLRIVVQGGPQI